MDEGETADVSFLNVSLIGGPFEFIVKDIARATTKKICTDQLVCFMLCKLLDLFFLSVVFALFFKCKLRTKCIDVCGMFVNIV